MQRERSRSIRSVLVLSAIMLFVVGCRSVLPPLLPESDDKGSLTVAVHGAALPANADAFFRIQLENSRQKYDLTKDVDVRPGDAPEAVAFENISLGRWRVTVHLIEESGAGNEDGTIAITHTGTQDVDVSGDTVHVDLRLLPNPGELELFMDLGPDCILVQDASGCLADDDRAARYATEPDVIQSNKRDFVWPGGESTYTVTTTDVPLGSYELQITFWEDKRTGKPVFQSDWSPFHISPGRRTRVEWRPDVGSVHIDLIVLGPPPPPADVILLDEGTGFSLTWLEPAGPIQSYNIYAKGPGQDVFCLVGETRGTVPHWSVPEENIVHCGDGDEQFFATRYAVTAINGDGYESVRSADVVIPGAPPDSN